MSAVGKKLPQEEDLVVGLAAGHVPPPAKSLENQQFDRSPAASEVGAPIAGWVGDMDKPRPQSIYLTVSMGIVLLGAVLATGPFGLLDLLRPQLRVWVLLLIAVPAAVQIVVSVLQLARVRRK